MTSVLSTATALVLVGALGAATTAFAATPVVHHAHVAAAMHAAPARNAPAKVMSETPNPNPTLADVFQASDGVIYTPVTHDPRSHGLPEY